MRINLIFLLLLFYSINLSGQGLRSQGKNIVNQQGNEVILRGMGLGGWMLMEGYMMQSSDVADTQHEFRERLVDLFGVDKTNTFFDRWQENHVTRSDIDSLAAWGFNSVRVPMHYNLFTLPIQEEPIVGENTWLTKGFTMIDDLLDWCEANQMYLILDLHAAPGGQGANAAISDYDSDLPSLWESDQNKNKTIALWQRLANRYKNEAWIGGYDLLNEVNWGLPNNNGALRTLYQDITAAIRAEDTDHIIFIEGNSFANDFNGLTPPWDNNMVYSFHKYWSENSIESIQWVLDLREENNVPLWMGEAGENSNVWFRDAIKLFEDNNIGWSWWPMKRIETIVSPYSIGFSEGYKNILEYWRGNAPRPSADEAFSIMMELANSTNSSQCDYQKDVPDSQIRQVSTDQTLPFTSHQIPGTINMSDYDMGRNGIAYFDVDDANYQLSTGSFQAWNSGWVYRNDGVDIETNNDNLYSNGYHVGFTKQGEWMNYTLTVLESAVYRMDSRIAALEAGGKFHLELDNEPITSILSTEASGEWDEFITQSFTDIVMEQGIHTMRLEFDGTTSFNISNLMFEKTGTLSSIDFTVLSAETDADGSRIQILVNQNIDKSTLASALQNFSLEVNGESREIIFITSQDDKQRAFYLTLSEPLIHSDQIQLDYSGNSILTSQGTVLEQFSQLVIVNKVPQLFQIPGKIESESYYYMFGIETESTTDTGGGFNIGYTNPGDYMDYLVEVAAPYEYDIKARVAAESNSGRVAFYIVSSEGVETHLLEMLFPVTQGWQNWKNTIGKIQLPAGNYILRIKVINGDFNLNWIEITYPDSDEDGVNDVLDQCPNTSIISFVDEQGCSLVPIPINNFTLRVENEACASSNNGRLFISATQTDNFTAILLFNGNEIAKSFTSSTDFSELQAGNYSLCIQLTDAPTVQQCFTVVVKQPNPLSVSSIVNPDTYQLSLNLKGANTYYIKLNKKEYSTTESYIQLPLSSEKNSLTIKTDLVCQGIYEEEMILVDFPKVSPNPIYGDFMNIQMGVLRPERSKIELYDILGNMIYSILLNGSAKIDVSDVPKGFYIMKLTKGKKTFMYKIVKK
tara:strand:- start:908 stop:4156 length:3249 start_codon:yes stop_codon:yes gene_type:complete